MPMLLGKGMEIYICNGDQRFSAGIEKPSRVLTRLQSRWRLE